MVAIAISVPQMLKQTRELSKNTFSNIFIHEQGLEGIPICPLEVLKTKAKDKHYNIWICYNST